MSLLESGLLNILDNEHEPFFKRLTVADNAFKSSEFLLPHKEAFLFKWIITNSVHSNKESWECFSNWLNSEQFKELNRGDIDNEEIYCIIKSMEEKIMLTDGHDISSDMTIITCSLILLENRICQQYFKYNAEFYCHFVSSIIQKISCAKYLEEVLKKNLFHKTIIEEETFHKYFLDIILPTLVDCLQKFNIPLALFEQVSVVVQKCIFYKNHNNYTVFVNQFFEDNKTEKPTVPKTLFKHLLNFYKDDTEKAKVKYKLILHALCKAYEADFNLLYKFVILLVHIIGFDLKDKLIIYKGSKLEIPVPEISLSKSQEIMLELLDILCRTNVKMDCSVKELMFSEFIRNILRQLLYLNTPSDTCYRIFIKAIIINPVVIEPIIDGLICYTMTADNRKQETEYENLIVSIFEVYSKLHRIENLIAKLVSSLYDKFNGATIALKEIYQFRGQCDIDSRAIKAKHFKIDNILTKMILEYVSTCICNLASWQVINVLKTLLHYLKKHLSCIDKTGNEDWLYFAYMKILSVLITTVLCSIRVAEHTIASNVVQKSVKELEELRNILQQFGMSLLNREHNHILMRSFLNIAYHWAEIYIILVYYSDNKEVQLKKSIDSDITPCNITYMHPYLSVKQWCLISERITNFGEVPCKLLLKKLYVQKLRALLLFEKSVNDDLVLSVTRNITSDLENNWRDILYDKFVINNLLLKMDAASVLLIAEYLINNIDDFEDLNKQIHISDSSLFLTAINYKIITKINKLLLKQKRKLNEDILKTALSTKICSTFTEKMLDENDHEEVLEKVKEVYNSFGNGKKYEWKINEEKLQELLKILKKFPIIYSPEVVQKICLLYLCSLHRDLSFEFGRGNYTNLQISCEDIIIGILQHSKFKVADLLEVDVFFKEMINSYNEWEVIFSLITENVFKYEYSIKKYELVVPEVTRNLSNSRNMRCCFIIINAVNKLKRTKISKDVKAVAEMYRTTICEKILEAISENNPEVNLVNGYSYALKTFLSQGDEKLSALLEHFNSYVEFAIGDFENSSSYLSLFTTILQNKSKIELLNDEFLYKVWNVYKDNENINLIMEEYAQLVVLIFGHIPNETFSVVTKDLLDITHKSISVKNYIQLSKHLKTWESVISCNLNHTKTSILQDVVEQLLQSLTSLLQESVYEGDLYDNICHFEKTIIQTNHLHLTSPMVDILILSITLIMSKEKCDFQKTFNATISLLEHLLKHRKSLVMDRLPPYLQQYRTILRCLCQKSDSDLNLEDRSVRKISDCAHQLEKLTRNLVSCQKDMGRIAMYLIADILEQYEQITLVSNVKIHLNNCIYSLISICDQHAISYLMRVLSSASTEMFKVMYENYKKYYRFTGKI